MRLQFPLFQSHLDLAHDYWSRLVRPGDWVIDATCGNGNDSLVLAQLALGLESGRLFAIDKQEAAIQQTDQLLNQHATEWRGQWQTLQQCHSTFPKEIKAESIALVVYNLGYLPGGNKAITTERSTTQQSLTEALKLLKPGGAISLTCYPGHPEGAEEERLMLELIQSLPPQQWSCCHHRWLNRNKAPSLLIIQRGC